MGARSKFCKIFLATLIVLCELGWVEYFFFSNFSLSWSDLS